MKYALHVILLAVFLCGCQSRNDRAQAASDADAGIAAAIGTLQKLGDYAAQPAIDILVGTRKYLAPAADVPHAEWPAPGRTPLEIEADSKGYGDHAPPEPQPWGAGVWAGIGTAATVGLWLSKRLLPLVPGIGGPIQSLIGTVADAAWSLTAHADQRHADRAKDMIATAAHEAAPLLELIRTLPAGTLPPQIQAALASPIVGAAVDHLAGLPIPSPTIPMEPVTT